MKKRVFSMLMVMIMMVSMLSVSVFAADHSGHTVDTAWENDATAHWHVCSDPACADLADAEQADYAAHTFNDTHKCTVCDYQGEHKWFENGNDAICTCGATHSHDLSYNKGNDTNHWQVCSGCADKKFNEAAHSYAKNDAKSTATNIVYSCVCGAEKSEHVHVWAEAWSTSGEKHWHTCADASCTEVNGEAAHTFTQSGTTATCSACGATKHVHVYSSNVSRDGTYHWYACECGDASGKEEHYDHNSSNSCDVCDASMSTQTVSKLTVTGLTAPAEGVDVDFTATVAESRFGTPSIKWNRVVDLSKNTSVAMAAGNKYAAGYMYNTSILVPMNSRDYVDPNIQITLDGVVVPYYETDAAFQSALKSFEGKYPVYAAKAMWTNDYLCICISVQYPTVAGTHSHDFGKGWLETPAKHYLKCVACGEVPTAEYHYDTDKSGFCDVCDYNMNYYNPNAPTYADGTAGAGTGTGTHTHSYSTDWVEDISNHWKQCTGCGAKTQTAAHADLNNTGACDVCGFIMKAAAGHTHSFSSDWTETFAQHYKVCACGAKNEIAAHADLNNTGKCDVCGYAMTTLSNNGIVADTGDNNATFLWLGAFVVAMMGFGATVLVARKKREE